MSDTPIDDRRFTDREVQEILKRAVEQSPSSGAIARREGLSLAELKTIGLEVGIDPERLESAARAVVLDQGSRPNRFLGAATVLNFERTVDGTLSPDETSEVLSRIRRVMGRQGEAQEIGGALEWSAKGESGERHVSVATRDGKTTIRTAANLGNAAVLTYLPMGVLGSLLTVIGLITFVRDGSVAGLVMLFTILPILYPILRTVFTKVSKGEAAKLQRVVDDLARLAAPSEEDDA